MLKALVTLAFVIFQLIVRHLWPLSVAVAEVFVTLALVICQLSLRTCLPAVQQDWRSMGRLATKCTANLAAWPKLSTSWGVRHPSGPCRLPLGIRGFRCGLVFI